MAVKTAGTATLQIGNYRKLGTLLQQAEHQEGAVIIPERVVALVFVDELVDQVGHAIEHSADDVGCSWCGEGLADARRDDPDILQKMRAHVDTCPKFPTDSRMRGIIRQLLAAHEVGSAEAMQHAYRWARELGFTGKDHWPDCAISHGGDVCDMGVECGTARPLEEPPEEGDEPEGLPPAGVPATVQLPVDLDHVQVTGVVGSAADPRAEQPTAAPAAEPAKS